MLGIPISWNDAATNSCGPSRNPNALVLRQWMATNALQGRLHRDESGLIQELHMVPQLKVF